MNIKGKIKTQQGRILDFEYKTDKYNNLIDDTLKINGTELDDYGYYFLAGTEIFVNKMFKDAVVTEINDIKFDNFDTEIISYVIGNDIQLDEDYMEWYLKEYDKERLDPDTIGDDFNYIIEEYICCTLDFHTLLEDIYELSNGYHYLSQWNRYLDGAMEWIYDEYKEYQEAEKIA